MINDRSRHISRFACISVLTLLASQASSYLVNARIGLGETVVINQFLHFTHIRNMGGVFGVLQGHGWVFGLVSFILVAALVIYLLRSRQTQAYEYICFAFIVGGGASNILDRLIYGSVVDFINVQQIPYWHYIFNTADVMIHVGLWPMLFITIMQSRSRKPARQEKRTKKD